MIFNLLKVKNIICFVILLIISVFAAGENFVDSLYFTVQMNKKSNNLLCCNRSDDMRDILAGPVLMDGASFLLYSRNGYVLFNKESHVLDSHSVYRDNKKYTASDPMRLILACPADSKTLLYFQHVGDSVAIFEKKLYKKSLTKVTAGPLTKIKDMDNSRIFNLASNGVTDETASRLYLMPGLVGYSSISNGKKWWTTDRFYSFASPVFCMGDEGFLSFFTGIMSDQKSDVQKSLINPLGTFTRDGMDYYYGVHSATCSTEPESHQSIYMCDQAGNLLSTSLLLKQVVTDDVLEYDKKRNTNYTVKRPSQFVCQPAIDCDGNMYFGTIDFDANVIEVKKRLFFNYIPTITEQSPDDEDLINAQRRFFLKSVNVSCNGNENRISTETGFIIRDEHGKRRKAELKDVSIKGFSVVLQRTPNQELKKRMAQNANGLPESVKHVRDSLNHLATFSCQYSISLFYDGKEKVRTYYFSPCEDVVAARVIGITQHTDIAVRVDLKNRAEVIIFAQDGSFENIFIFNREDVRKRKDIIAIADNGTIVEEDYERIKEDYTYYKWGLSTGTPVLLATGQKKNKS
jgi:hypothetical protein